MKLKLAILGIVSYLFTPGSLKAQWQIQQDTALYGQYYSSISFVSDSVGFLVGCTEFSAWNSIGLFKTTDRGTSWKLIKGASGGGCGIPNSFPDAKTGYCIISFGTFQANELQKTTDRGLSWYQPDTTGSLQLGTLSFHGAVYFVDTMLGFISSDQGIYRTSNGGKSWQTVAPHAVTSFFFTSVQTGYAAGAHMILKTSDGGNSWNVADTNHSVVSLHFPSPNIGYATGANGVILKTTNGGNSWWPQSTGISGVIALNSVFCTDTNHCYAVGEQGTILYTADGGLTWTKQSSGVKAGLHAVSCTDVQCFAVGDTSVLLRTTAGITGIEQDGKRANAIVIFPNPFSTETTISMNLLSEGPVSLRLYSVLGEEAGKVDECISREIRIKRGNLKNGLYFVHITRDGRTLLTGKLILTD